jgi:Right handed beta helix region
MIVLLAFGAAPATAEHVQCGAVLTLSTALDSDLRDCPGDGIVIRTDGVDLDLNGHVVDGVGSGSGVRVERGFFEPVVGIRVHDGTVQEFGDGITLTSADGAEVQDVAVSDNQGFGIFLNSSGEGGDAKPKVERNTIVGTGPGFGSAALALSSSEAVVADNEVVNNDAHGVLISLGGAVLGRNIVSRNAGDGVHFSFSFGQVFENVIAANAGDGVEITFSSYAELLTRNTITGNGQNGLRFDGGAAGPVNRNVVSRNELDGIAVQSTFRPMSFDRNRGDRNGDDGIDVDSPDVSLSDNRANWNVDFGIEAAPGTVDGGGNRARRNGNPAQCVGVTCR